MLVKVEARTRQGTLLTLPLDDVANGLIIESIEGLDPVKATIVTSSFANEDGEQEHSSRREARDIKLTIDLESDYGENTISVLRQRLYSFFMPKSQVFLRFIDNERDPVDIVGRVEVFETPIFAKEPQVSISVHCPGPDFVVPVPVVIPGMTVESNDELTSATAVNYEGTVETGIVVTVEANRPEGAFTIYNRTPDGVLRQMDFSAGLVAGDKVRISSVSGAKSASLTRQGSVSPVLYGLSPTSSWINLEQGINLFRVYATGTPIPYTLEYVTRHGGL